MNETRPATHDLMACLGEESRFRLVQALIGGARCVTDLAAAVGLSQSCTTRHLQVLERRRLVTGRRDGKRVLYRIREDDPGLLPLLGWALSDPEFRPRPGRRATVSASRRVALAPGRRPHGAGAAADKAGPPAPSISVPEATPRVATPEQPPSAPVPLPIEPQAAESAGRSSRSSPSDIEDYLL